MSKADFFMKRRKLIYKDTFLQWKPERRLSTFEQSAIELSLNIHKFGNNPTDDNFKSLSESIADVKTMIEVNEMTFPSIKPMTEAILKEKLHTLDKRTQEAKREKKEEAKEEPKVIDLKTRSSSDKKKTFLQKLKLRK